MQKKILAFEILVVLTLVTSATETIMENDYDMQENSIYFKHRNPNRKNHGFKRDLSSSSQESDDYGSTSYSKESESSSESLEYDQLRRNRLKIDCKNKSSNYLNIQNGNLKRNRFQYGRRFGLNGIRKRNHYDTNDNVNLDVDYTENGRWQHGGGNKNRNSKGLKKFSSPSKTGNWNANNINRNKNWPNSNTNWNLQNNINIISANKNTNRISTNKNTKTNAINKGRNGNSKLQNNNNRNTYSPKNDAKSTSSSLNRGQGRNFRGNSNKKENSEFQNSSNINNNSKQKSGPPSMLGKNNATYESQASRKNGTNMQSRGRVMIANINKNDNGTKQYNDRKDFTNEHDSYQNGSVKEKGKQLGRGFQGGNSNTDGNNNQLQNNKTKNKSQGRKSNPSYYMFMDLGPSPSENENHGKSKGNLNNKSEMKNNSTTTHNSNMTKDNMQGRNFMQSQKKKVNNGLTNLQKNKGLKKINEIMGRNMNDRKYMDSNVHGGNTPSNKSSNITSNSPKYIKNGSITLNISINVPVLQNGMQSSNKNEDKVRNNTQPQKQGSKNGSEILERNMKDREDMDPEKYGGNMQSNTSSSVSSNVPNIGINGTISPNNGYKRTNSPNNGNKTSNSTNTRNNRPNFTSGQNLPDYGENRQNLPENSDNGDNPPDYRDNEQNWADYNNNEQYTSNPGLIDYSDDTDNGPRLLDYTDNGKRFPDKSFVLPILESNTTNIPNNGTSSPSKQNKTQSSTATKINMQGRTLSHSNCKKKKNKKPRENHHSL